MGVSFRAVRAARRSAPLVDFESSLTVEGLTDSVVAAD
jgi:hypothetical protein